MRSNWMMGAFGAVLALVVVALLGAGMAESKPGHRGCHGRGPDARFERLEAKLADLALPDETRTAAEQVIAQARTESETRHEEMRDAHQALRDLLDQETPALEQVMAQADVIGVLETEAHKAKLRTMIELRALVGPEQWQVLKDSLRHGRGERMEKS